MGKNKSGAVKKGKQKVGKRKVVDLKQSKKKLKKKHTWKSVRQKKRETTEVEEQRNEQPQSSIPKKSLKGQQQGSLRSRMLERLSVARFRTLNESIDSEGASPSSSSSLSNQSTFLSYHKGLRTASSTWRTNPLHSIVSWLKSSVPDSSVVADFGCGDASLAKSIPHKTYSFDLHDDLDPGNITACDMSSVPLEDASVDVAVFCLSLMGSEVSAYLREAWRVLKPAGALKIGEVKGRIQSQPKFVRQVESLGFKKVNVHVMDGDLFVVLQFRKVASGGRNNRGRSTVELGGVVYKKR